MDNSSKFFSNADCEYFPCHGGVPEGEFNCLYCYCPLYMLGPDCGGDFTYTDTGVKSCLNCNLPHRGLSGGDMVARRFDDIARRAGAGSEADAGRAKATGAGGDDATRFHE